MLHQIEQVTCLFILFRRANFRITGSKITAIQLANCSLKRVRHNVTLRTLMLQTTDH